MADLYLIQGADSILLSDNVHYRHLSHDGFGMPQLHRLTERGPLQHGETDLGFRLDSRLVNLVILVMGADWDDHWVRREELLSFLTPVAMTRLRFILDNGAIRQLDCYCVQGPFFASIDTVQYSIKVGFTLKAADPVWYDPGGEGMSFSLGGGTDTMLVPTVIPMTIGASTVDASEVVDYSGTWLTYPTIRITGPITDCKIVNNSTGEKLDFTGITIAAGDWYEIDCRYGYKTVKNAAGANKIADLTDDSDLASFHIAAAPEVAGGQNSITVTGTGATLATAVSFVYFTRFIGL